MALNFTNHLLANRGYTVQAAQQPFSENMIYDYRIPTINAEATPPCNALNQPQKWKVRHQMSSQMVDVLSSHVSFPQDATSQSAWGGYPPFFWIPQRRHLWITRRSSLPGQERRHSHLARHRAATRTDAAAIDRIPLIPCGSSHVMPWVVGSRWFPISINSWLFWFPDDGWSLSPSWWLHPSLSLIPADSEVIGKWLVQSMVGGHG